MENLLAHHAFKMRRDEDKKQKEEKILNCKFIIAKIYSWRVCNSIHFLQQSATPFSSIATCALSLLHYYDEVSSFCILIIFNSSKYLHSSPLLFYFSSPCLLCNIHAAGKNSLLLFYKLLVVIKLLRVMLDTISGRDTVMILLIQSHPMKCC